MEADSSQSHAGRKINSSSREYKLEAVRLVVECNSNYEAAKKFNVISQSCTDTTGVQFDNFPLIVMENLLQSINRFTFWKCKSCYAGKTDKAMAITLRLS